jgi:hypothetical protein
MSHEPFRGRPQVVAHGGFDARLVVERSGTQFDPAIAQAFVELIRRQASRGPIDTDRARVARFGTSRLLTLAGERPSNR